ncbi:MAG: phosphoenolpyruvate carboxykinase (ATP) [Bacteriovoracaceae bacterium]|nr:phosphoenolpyruvate carboxykinase (ATP) [Bacteriovoracaceae bacterium]
MKDLLAELGIEFERTPHAVNINPPNSFLIEKSIASGQGRLSENGALVIKTGKYTGRAAKDKYVVKAPSTEDTIWWENNILPMSPEVFEKLKKTVIQHFNENTDLFVTDKSIGTQNQYSLGLRLISTSPSHAIFSNHLFRDAITSPRDSNFTILHAPTLIVDPKEFGTRSETIITTCFDCNTIIIVGTKYAGEIKKSAFSIMNYLLPKKKILPMHAGANKNKSNNNVSVFFGLSGTGKTTLSTDDGRLLIGDDEHGLHNTGIFNFEGGCYAKTYKLSATVEPGIYNASTQYGSILENVILNPENRRPDFNDCTITENGRSSYPLTYIEDVDQSAQGGIPSHIFFLTADAFGVLPPVSKLTKIQAKYYFILGYTSKLAGTEDGIKEPQATFSSCFGAPFMLRHPIEYATLLGEYLSKFKMNVWLINTGWTGGPYGVGNRYPIQATRQIIRSIQADALNDVTMKKDPIFGLNIPKKVDGVSSPLLNPAQTWKKHENYLIKAQELALSFHKQMAQFEAFDHDLTAGSPTYGNNGHSD